VPEQITKHPDVTLQVLAGAGGVCGRGAPQKILTRCPADRFCALPTGEICVFGIPDIPRMTQITRTELAPVVCPGAHAAPGLAGLVPALDGTILTAAFLTGLALGRLRRTRRR
jgi:hypothetical protein